MLQISIYALKKKFQTLLEPLRDMLVRYDITPNQITLVTCFACILYAIAFVWIGEAIWFLVFFPLLLIVRMALNALDGMIASHTKNKTALGAVLNETCDYIADAALFFVFLLLTPFFYAWLFLIFMSLFLEFVSLAIFQAVGHRPQVGPFGKSDRAVYLGLLAMLMLLFPNVLVIHSIYIGLGIVLSVLTLWNRLAALATHNSNNVC